MSDIWVRAALAQENEELTSEQSPAATGKSGSPQESLQESSQDPPPPPTPTLQDRLMSMLPFILIFVVMYLFLFRGPKKKQAEHKKMLSSLQKNDRVRTIGGILGTVIDIRDDEVTLKVDESNNTKIKVTTGSIGTVLSDTDR